MKKEDLLIAADFLISFGLIGILTLHEIPIPDLIVVILYGIWRDYKVRNEPATIEEK